MNLEIRDLGSSASCNADVCTTSTKSTANTKAQASTPKASKPDFEIPRDLEAWKSFLQKQAYQEESNTWVPALKTFVNGDAQSAKALFEQTSYPVAKFDENTQSALRAIYLGAVNPKKLAEAPKPPEIETSSKQS